MRLKPVNDKIVVKESEKNNEEKTAGGIILPDTVQDGGLCNVIHIVPFSISLCSILNRLLILLSSLILLLVT